jgi:hypothetical protein
MILMYHRNAHGADPLQAFSDCASDAPAFRVLSRGMHHEEKVT